MFPEWRRPFKERHRCRRRRHVSDMCSVFTSSSLSFGRVRCSSSYTLISASDGRKEFTKNQTNPASDPDESKELCRRAVEEFLAKNGERLPAGRTAACVCVWLCQGRQVEQQNPAADRRAARCRWIDAGLAHPLATAYRSESIHRSQKPV